MPEDVIEKANGAIGDANIPTAGRFHRSIGTIDRTLGAPAGPGKEPISTICLSTRAEASDPIRRDGVP
jgi:hypothetical protein